MGSFVLPALVTNKNVSKENKAGCWIEAWLSDIPFKYQNHFGNFPPSQCLDYSYKNLILKTLWNVIWVEQLLLKANFANLACYFPVKKD